MRHASFDVLNAESEISYMESKQENEEVDLWEILADEETDTEGSSVLFTGSATLRNGWRRRTGMPIQRMFWCV